MGSKMRSKRTASRAGARYRSGQIRLHLLFLRAQSAVSRDSSYRWMSSHTELVEGRRVSVREVPTTPKITLSTTDPVWRWRNQNWALWQSGPVDDSCDRKTRERQDRLFKHTLEGLPGWEELRAGFLGIFWCPLWRRAQFWCRTAAMKTVVLQGYITQ